MAQVKFQALQTFLTNMQITSQAFPKFSKVRKSGFFFWSRFEEFLSIKFFEFQFVLVNVVVAVLMKHLEESNQKMRDNVASDNEGGITPGGGDTDPGYKTEGDTGDEKESSVIIDSNQYTTQIITSTYPTHLGMVYKSCYIDNWYRA